MLHHVVQYKFTKVSQKHAASIFMVEESTVLSYT
jgi:hypothetical protein